MIATSNCDRCHYVFTSDKLYEIDGGYYCHNCGRMIILEMLDRRAYLWLNKNKELARKLANVDVDAIFWNLLAEEENDAS